MRKSILSFILLFTVVIDFSIATTSVEISETELSSHCEAELECHDSEDHHSEEGHCHGICHVGHTHIAIFSEIAFTNSILSLVNKESSFEYTPLLSDEHIKKIIRPPIS